MYTICILQLINYNANNALYIELFNARNRTVLIENEMVKKLF